MKRLSTIVLAVILLVVPCRAAEQASSTPLKFGTSDTVYGISACYEVNNQNVETIEVSFIDSIKNYAYANYSNGELRISIASVEPLNLSEALGQVTATLSDGTQEAPELVLKSLKFNGKKATCNLIPGEVTVTNIGEDLTVSVSVHNDFPSICYVLIAAYRENGQMMYCTMQNGDVERKDFSLSVSMEDCADAAYIEVFYITDTFKPITAAETVFIASN